MRSFILAVSALCCLAAGAHAAVIIQTQQVSFANANGLGINNLATFNPALGVLTGATGTLTGTYTENLHPALFPGDPIPASSLVRSVLSLAILGDTFNPALPSVQLPYDTVQGVFHVSLPVSTSFTLSSRALLAAVGGPPAELDLTAGSFPGVGGTGYFGNPGVVGQVTLTYTYTPTSVPEPMSLALMASGLLGFLSMSRTRRSWG